jgi:hypothetical protein
MEARPCHLTGDVVGASPCTGTACGFWEDEGCIVERLGLHRLEGAGLRALLLELRVKLEAARYVEQRATSRGEFARRLGRDD